jgi:GT2 family glycosyltransferase
MAYIYGNQYGSSVKSYGGNTKAVSTEPEKMTNTAPTLSVVIVSWNTKRLLAQCLESLEHCRGLLLEIIVVDNASADGTGEMLRERFPQVRLVQNEANLGFAKANNIGIDLSSGDYVSLINSDVSVPAGCLEKMITYLKEHNDIGMLGPKMILSDGTVGQSCMRFPTVWNWFCSALALDSIFKKSTTIGNFMMTDFTYDTTQDVDLLTGWFWMVRREALDKVGKLDERFFMYGEDFDWPKRFHQCGWRVVFYHEAEAFHHCGASSALAPARFYVEMNKANLQYFKKHHNRLAVVGFWLTIWLRQVLRIAGYSVVYLFKHSQRVEASLKLKRSLRCVVWLMSPKSSGEER